MLQLDCNMSEHEYIWTACVHGMPQFSTMFRYIVPSNVAFASWQSRRKKQKTHLLLGLAHFGLRAFASPRDSRGPTPPLPRMELTPWGGTPTTRPFSRARSATAVAWQGRWAVWIDQIHVAPRTETMVENGLVCWYLQEK